MIKLNRKLTPLYLSPHNVDILTNEYKGSGKSVWLHKEIKWGLLELSNKKCSYCECELNEESKYMEVEHFEDKDNNPDKVVVWDNLLPSCKRCNVAKGTHDVIKEPIVNPFVLDPREHFSFHFYRLKGITQEGKSSEDVLDLNNYEKVLKKRFDIGNAIQESLIEIIDKITCYEISSSTRTKNRIISQFKGVLRECIPESSYSATAATILHLDNNYPYIIGKLKDLKLWDEECDELNNKSLECVLKCA